MKHKKNKYMQAEITSLGTCNSWWPSCVVGTILSPVSSYISPSLFHSRIKLPWARSANPFPHPPDLIYWFCNYSSYLFTICSSSFVSVCHFSFLFFIFIFLLQQNVQKWACCCSK